MAKEGRKSKSDGLTFNDTFRITKEDERKARAAIRDAEREKLRLEKAQAKKAKEPEEDGEIKLEQRILNDLRDIYFKKEGKKKLLAMMQDDKELKFLIKELLKFEIAQMTARIRKEGGAGEGGPPAGGAILVVLKGLETERPILAAIGSDKTLDLSQVLAAMDPGVDSRVKESGFAAADRPEEIVRQLKRVEDE